jgi:hypothetical protein
VESKLFLGISEEEEIINKLVAEAEFKLQIHLK